MDFKRFQDLQARAERGDARAIAQVTRDGRVYREVRGRDRRNGRAFVRGQRVDVKGKAE